MTMEYDGINKIYQKHLKEQEKLKERKIEKLTFTKKALSEYNKRDFVLYFKNQYETINDLPHHEINIPAACGVIGVILNIFYKAGYSNRIILQFINYALQKGKVEGRNVKLRNLHYDVSDFLFELKKIEDWFGSVKDKVKKIEGIENLKGKVVKLIGEGDEIEEVTLDIIKNIWNKEMK